MVLVRFLNPLLMIVLGLLVGVLLAGRRVDAWRYYFAGAATFVLSQVLHIPFNAWLLAPVLKSFSGGRYELLLTAVLLGLSAGVFEECARWAAYRFAIREARDWRAGLMFGAGHGGVEAILLGFLSLYTVMQLYLLAGSGAPVVLESVPLEDVGRVQAQAAAFWSLPWYAVLLGALERLFAITFHLSASLLVLQVFRRGGWGWLALAVGWHALLDASVVFVSATWGAYAAEALLGALALAALGIILALRDAPEADAASGDDREGDSAVLELQPAAPTEEDLDDSRFV